MKIHKSIIHTLYTSMYFGGILGLASLIGSILSHRISGFFIFLFPIFVWMIIFVMDKMFETPEKKSLQMEPTEKLIHKNFKLKVIK